jgi:hypothetical protein
LELNLETKIKEDGEPTDPSLHLPPIASQGIALAFHTLSVLLDNQGDPSIYPSAHLSLSFIWSLALHPLAMQQVDKFIPWANIASFLNTLIDSDVDFSKTEGKAFPLDDGAARHLPEDFFIRGQSWSQFYFPEGFFEDAPPEHKRLLIEQHIISRKHRCLWLGVRIATVCSYFICFGIRNMLQYREMMLIESTCSSCIG